MAYNPQNPNGQTTSANSAPVVIASNQTAVPTDVNDGSGNAITSNSITTTSTRGLDVNVRSILGTAPTSVGALNIQGLSGGTAVTTTDTNITSTTASLNGTLPSSASLDAGQVRTSEQAALTNGKITAYIADKVGKQIVLLNANPENFTSGTASATGTASTSVVSVPASGLKVYITDITVVNTGITTTNVSIQNGNGGSTIATLIAPTGGGQSLNFRTPLATMSTATAVYFAAGNSTSTLYVTISGYIGA